MVQASKAARKSIRRNGFRDGFRTGYFYGRCERISQMARDQALAQPIPVRPITVLFVTSGKGFPYSPLDQAIFETLQRMVANAVSISPRDHLPTVAAQLRPDLVFVLDGLGYPVEQIIEARTMGFRTAIWLADDPYYTDWTRNIVPHFDYVFTLELNAVPFYQSLGCAQVHYLPFAVSPNAFKPSPVSVIQRKDIRFIGSGFWNRVHFFDQMTPFLLRHNVRLSGIWWDRLRDYKQLAGSIDLGQWLDPAATSAAYNGSKMVINMHRAHDDITINHNTANVTAASPNPRTFEINACGVMQLTDIRSDLPRFYTPGYEIVTYGSPAELEDKIRYYLEHEDEREQIALRGLARTLAEHTYERRLNQLLQTVFG